MNLDITEDEALVLFDLLSRYSENDQFVIEDQAEQRALWSLALWLEQKQIELIIKQWRELPENSTQDTLDQWGDLAFRCNAALHNAGLKSE